MTETHLSGSVISKLIRTELKTNLKSENNLIILGLKLLMCNEG